MDDGQINLRPNRLVLRHGLQTHPAGNGVFFQLMVCGITQLSQVHRHFLHSPVQLPGRLALRHKIRRIIRQAFQAENALFHLFQQRCCHILYIRGGSVHKIILQGIHSALQQAEIRKKAAFQPPAQLQFIRCIFLLRVQGIGQCMFRHRKFLLL